MTFIIVISIIEFLSLIALVSFGVSIFSKARKAAPAHAAVKFAHEPKVQAEPLKKEEPLHLPEIVEHIDAEEADHMISDDLALAFVVVEEEGHKTIGLKGHVNLGDIDDVFNAGDIITLEKLKEKQLVSKKVKRLKVLADGVLNKPITVKSHSFSIQAIKMIELTGGTVVKLK